MKVLLPRPRFAVGVSMIALLSGMAIAQTDAAPAEASAAQADESYESEEVVVTAFRRKSSMQKVPAAIEVVSGEKLDRAQVGDSMAFQFQTSGVVITKDAGQMAQIYIRGVGNNLQGISAGNSVATYVDGVYIPNSIQALQQFNDVERIEVLKGPQATLYGRNATGGAVNIISADPSYTPGGKIDASYGNYKAYSARATINTVLVEDKVAARLSVQMQEHEGYAENVYYNTHLEGNQSVGVRGALRFDITPEFSAILRADYSFARGSDYVKIRNPNSFWYLISPVQQYIDDPRKISSDVDGYQPTYNTGASVKLNWETGIGDITSITSYRHFKSGPNAFDLDQVAVPPGVIGGAPYRGSYLADLTRSRSIYHETYLTTDASESVRAIVGANYFYEDAHEYQLQYAGGLSSYNRYGLTNAYSVYVDGSWDVTSDFTISAGVRYSHEKRDYNQVRLIPYVPYVENDRSWSAVSPRFGIEYRASDTLMFYANVTSGFKSGGFNLQNPMNPFEPEKIWSYEAGLKSSWLDNRLRANLSAFHYKYEDIQISQTLANLQRVVTNGGAAKINGVDLEISFDASADLMLGMNVSLLDTEYGETILCDTVIAACTVPAAMVNIEGRRLPRAPDLALTAFFDYTVPQNVLPGELTFHMDGSYRSRTYWTPFEFKPHSTGGQGLVNAQLRYDAPSGWYGAFFVQNIFDKLYVTNGIGSAQLRSGGAVIGVPANFDRFAPPRLFGVKVGYNF